VTLALVQPFGLGSPGGGPRILRMLVESAPMPTLSVCTSPSRPPPDAPVPERHLPARPALGRLETTRANAYLGALELACGPALARRLESLFMEHEVSVVHGVGHSTTFWWAFVASRRRRLPYLLSVHDDLRWSLAGRPEQRFGAARLARVWREADERFVIGEEMGQEYDRRYGARPYSIVTDAAGAVAAGPPHRSPDGLRVYFMGAFHLSYRRNLDCLLAALDSAVVRRAFGVVSMRLRCGAIPDYRLDARVSVEVLPFEKESALQRDLEQADALYLPLPFEYRQRDFVRLSFSTKLVTYLASGLPIVYHGPAAAAAARLLADHDAAVVVTSLDPDDIASALIEARERADVLGRNALALARTRFNPEAVCRRFWRPVMAATTS
jgi:glycosyltransferase involved in cell wall biosynthesis